MTVSDTMRGPFAWVRSHPPRHYRPTIAGNSAGVASFNPLTQVTALHAMWANDTAWTNPGDGNPVTSWRNQSGGGDPASAGSARPTFVAINSDFGNHASIHFTSASSQYLGVDIADIAQSCKVVTVFKLSAGAGVAESVIGFGGGVSRDFRDVATDQWRVNAGANLLGGTSDTLTHVARFTLNGASSQLWIDETSIVTGDAGANGISVLTIGTSNNGLASLGAFLQGDVAFVGIYTGATSDASLSSLCNSLRLYYNTA